REVPGFERQAFPDLGVIKEAYRRIVDVHAKTCASGNESRLCDQLVRTRAVRLSRLGLLGAQHPLFDVVHYTANNFVTDDFRSALAFEEAARSHFLKEVTAERKLTVVYPGSGSHLAPLVLPMKLIDDHQIEEAKLLYYEINATSAAHVVNY